MTFYFLLFGKVLIYSNLLAHVDVRVPDLGQNQTEEDDDGVPGGADQPDDFLQGKLCSALTCGRFEPLGSS